MKKGDTIICYIAGRSVFAAILEIVSDPFKDTKLIWLSDVFPSRVRVRPVLQVELRNGVAVRDLIDKLSIFKNQKTPRSWRTHFLGSPRLWKSSDAKAVIMSLEHAARAATRPAKRQLTTSAATRNRT